MRAVARGLDRDAIALSGLARALVVVSRAIVSVARDGDGPDGFGTFLLGGGAGFVVLRPNM